MMLILNLMPLRFMVLFSFIALFFYTRFDKTIPSFLFYKFMESNQKIFNNDSYYSSFK